MSATGLDGFVAANALNLWLALRSATALLVRTESAGPPPPGFSSTELVTQHLELAVEETLCGPPSDARLELDVTVVRGAHSADPSGGLASWIVTPGSRFVALLEGGVIADEDLGALEASDALVAWIRAACSGPPPPGLGTALYERARRGPLPGIVEAVVDVADPGTGERARLTVVDGHARVFTGIRAERVARSRPPDARVSISADELDALLRGERVEPRITGDDRGVIAALAG